jgi:hypothetical protein
MKPLILSVAVLFTALSVPARIVTLYYTEDGQNVLSINGYEITEDLTLNPDGDESWLVIVGQKFGPNGYLPKDSKLSLGTLGKTHSLFMPLQEPFLGIGVSRTFDHPINFDDIAYVVPDTAAFGPFHVFMTDGTHGDFFVNGEYTESAGAKVIQNKLVNELYIIRLKYNKPKSQRGPGDRPDQIGIRALGFSFSESALKKAIRRGAFKD